MISHILEKEIIEMFYKKGKFSKLQFNDKEFQYITEQQLSKKIVRAIIANYTQNEIIKSHHRYLNLVKHKTIQNVTELLTLSEKYNIPPYKLAKMINYKIDATTDKQIQRADRFTHPKSIQKSQRKAMKFEDTFEKKLLKLKVKNFKTENDLRKLNQPLTPDFLFPSGLKVKGKTINWIDVKNFYGSANNFTISRLKKQAAKYHNAFGDGCFVFRFNYSEELKIEHCLLLDYKEFVYDLLKA